MVMERDGIAGMGLEIMGKRYADPVRRPIAEPTGSGADRNVALIAAINGLAARLDALVPGSGRGISGGLAGAGQAVQFMTVDLTAARTLFEVTVPADYDYCSVFCDGTTEGITIRQRDHSGDEIDIGHCSGFPLVAGTNKLFVTNDLVAGRTQLVLGFSIGEPLRLGVESANIRMLRWGIAREPAWVDGGEQTAPAAGTDLATQTVTAAMTGRLFGVSIAADEANTFDVYLDAVATLHYALAAAGQVVIVLPTPLVDSVAAGTVIDLRNVTAGGAGKVYHAMLLYDEA